MEPLTPPSGMPPPPPTRRQEEGSRRRRVPTPTRPASSNPHQPTGGGPPPPPPPTQPACRHTEDDENACSEKICVRCATTIRCLLIARTLFERGPDGCDSSLSQLATSFNSQLISFALA